MRMNRALAVVTILVAGVYLPTKLSERTEKTALSGIMPDIPPLGIDVLKRKTACDSREVGFSAGIRKIRNVFRAHC